MHRVLVLGTGTEIGKTWVTCGIARAAPAGSVLALKPIETGCTETTAADAAALAAAAGTPYIPPLYSYPEPITPWLAATHAGASIDAAAIAHWTSRHCEAFDVATRRSEPLRRLCVIETAGGAFSPLTADATNVDLAAALLPAATILVVPNRLGCLHDARATLDALRLAHVTPTLLVLNCGPWADTSTSTNLQLLRALHPTLPIEPLDGPAAAVIVYNKLLTLLPVAHP